MKWLLGTERSEFHDPNSLAHLCLITDYAGSHLTWPHLHEFTAKDETAVIIGNDRPFQQFMRRLGIPSLQTDTG